MLAAAAFTCSSAAGIDGYFCNAVWTAAETVRGDELGCCANSADAATTAETQSNGIRLRIKRKRRPALCHMEDLFESVVHVKLLVAVRERQAGIVRSRVDFNFAEGLNEHHVFQNARGRFAVDFR